MGQLKNKIQKFFKWFRNFWRKKWKGEKETKFLIEISEKLNIQGEKIIIKDRIEILKINEEENKHKEIEKKINQKLLNKLLKKEEKDLEKIESLKKEIDKFELEDVKIERNKKECEELISKRTKKRKKNK